MFLVTSHWFSIQIQPVMKNICPFYSILIFTLIFFGFNLAHADLQQESPASVNARSELAGKSEDESLIKQNARKRIYPGGRDEEPLRVQIQMSQPTRKMGPATEAPEPTSTSADD